MDYLQAAGISCEDRMATALDILNKKRRAAAEHLLDIEYRYQDYLAQDYLSDDSAEHFNLMIMVCYDFPVLSEEKQGILLGRVGRALKPEGKFAFDVFTAQSPSHKEASSWSLSGPNGGFWSAAPYLSLFRKFHYPETDAWLGQYLIVRENLTASRWMKCWEAWTDRNTAQELPLWES